MIRRHTALPQFNWPVFGPLLGILATLAVVSLVLLPRVWPAHQDASTALGANPQRDAPLPANPGIGGPDPALQAPSVRSAALATLSARVVGAPTLRRGPGTEYPTGDTLANGAEVHVIACSPGCSWLRLLTLGNADAQVWIPAVFLSVNGAVDGLPVLTPR